MSSIIDIANEVAYVLAITVATVRLAPEFSLDSMDELNVAIVPKGVEFTAHSRSASEKTVKIDIGVMKKCSDDEVESLLNTVQSICGRFERLRLGSTRALCVKVENNPIYAPEHLVQRKQFTSVITLTFKIIS
jgi:hypothetical protein